MNDIVAQMSEEHRWITTSSLKVFPVMFEEVMHPLGRLDLAELLAELPIIVFSLHICVVAVSLATTSIGADGGDMNITPFAEILQIEL
ncbi:MAG: hypothetical protein M3R08_10790, partial [Bacteroidota bacterium]|nr:hypothetical protein [Bacteroidota bacterium]